VSYFGRGDRVITPTGETAQVVSVAPDDRLHLEYVGALRRDHAQLSLPAKLCRKIEPGQRVPEPARVKVLA